MKIIKIIAVFSVLVVGGGAGYIYFGLYPMGADVPHNKLSYWVLETLRERSVAKASASIEVPDLSNLELLVSGGTDYDKMCADCHLKPGQSESDLVIGMYPSPPNLSVAPKDHGHSHADGGHDPQQKLRRQYWIIKHGIKASGMPAWGLTHSDERMWAMVAFLQKLPELTSAEYRTLTTGHSVGTHHKAADVSARHVSIEKAE